MLSIFRKSSRLWATLEVSCKHAWSVLRYIPDRVAGAAMFAPMANPYDFKMTKDERRKTWDSWSTKRKLMHILARRFPSLLPFFYRQTFLSGKQGQPESWLSLSLGKKDKTLLEGPVFNAFWERNVAESVRQGDARPFVEEDVLQVSDWGFSLSDIQMQKKEARGFFELIKSLFNQVERVWVGFLGPIHIWQVCTLFSETEKLTPAISHIACLHTMTLFRRCSVAA